MTSTKATLLAEKSLKGVISEEAVAKNAVHNGDKRVLLSRLPSVDVVLKQLADLIVQCGHQQVADAVRAELASRRDVIAGGAADSSLVATATEDIVTAVNTALAVKNQSSLLAVFNLTGTVLHTNLGRAILPPQALQAVICVASSSSNLEFDLTSGKRGDRDSHIEALVCELTGAEAATAVNNNAAAVLLVLNTLALTKEVPVSRGELVEIGGSFRIPEVMQRSGCTLVEIGATNRTHLGDYEQAITESTALLMKVHTSNYRIEGFTKNVAECDLAELAHKYKLPLVVDLGSGSLINFKALGLPDEPTVAEVISNGVDVVTFSGDKLLGGPQCGIIAGRKELIDQIRRNPLKRALRLDKMTLAALAEVLKLYRNPATLIQELPTLRHLTRLLTDIREQAQRILPALAKALPPIYAVSIVDCFSQIGSGALPVATIASVALSITSEQTEDVDIRRLADLFRGLPQPVIARIHKGALLLDLRCLDNETAFVAQLNSLAEKFQ